ncbi:MAG: hypothetical protein OXL96_25520 [Candidatus Poribacteria bacterium]|nr:hypothetical protein [Candidatus Poribacteria bacterium]
MGMRVLYLINLPKTLSWNTRNSPAQAASRGNDTPTNTNSWLGFRCAKSAPPQQDAEANPSSDTAE